MCSTDSSSSSSAPSSPTVSVSGVPSTLLEAKIDNIDPTTCASAGSSKSHKAKANMSERAAKNTGKKNKGIALMLYVCANMILELASEPSGTDENKITFEITINLSFYALKEV
jgi:hypothetical protein